MVYNDKQYYVVSYDPIEGIERTQKKQTVNTSHMLSWASKRQFGKLYMEFG